MPTIEHSSLTGAELHEPKGADSATANTVYVANGSGSGVWTGVTYTLSGSFADVSSASSVYVPIPYAGTVKKITTVLQGSISTTDDTITVYNAAGASMGTITVAVSGSAAGTVDTLSPSSNNTVSADSYIRLTSAGASASAQVLNFTVVVERT